ncbi:chymotrypsin/elastase isoinhibitor 1 [Bicyclus anynana]|uniref:Chymotrypsin/elastase isoinhibitor 1 n=1 Tax=Bicyclus anynana TaxID=110368 RepID=A0A6J1MU08_BICAN|nr:chymotrypsin/elastase isoinhibitor 1 [Bicyclus anynana]
MIAKVFVVLAFLAYVTNSTPVDEQKPFDCPPNEIYYKCSPLACYKKCEHLLKPRACPLVTADCYQPACECINNYLRDKQGKCIPTIECPKLPNLNGQS